MKRIVSISEIVDSREVTKGTREVIATGEARFDEAKSELVIDLASQALITDARGHETRISADWLPRPETIREPVSPDEAQPLARELFHRWTARIRAGLAAPVGA